jgi:ADP-ribose pyrophosphatase YjhB (NUDIX family)
VSGRPDRAAREPGPARDQTREPAPARDQTREPGPAREPGRASRNDLLHADAVRVLTAWHAPDGEAAATRARFLALLAAEPGAVLRDHPGAHLTASTMVVDPTGDRVLLCLHGRFGVWVQLGGHCEMSDVTVVDAARREATEESGIDGLVLSPEPIGVDVHRVHCSAGRSLHYDIRFAALAPAGAIARASTESRDLAWFPPHALPSPLAGATEPLVAPALTWARRFLGR